VALSRREFLGACGAGTAALCGLDAFGLEPGWLEVTEHQVPIGGLPAGLEGLTVAQITDAHLTGFGRVERSIVEALRARPASIVAFTGDIVDSEAGLPVLDRLASELAATHAKLVAILGNWEHWSRISLAELGARYAALGVELLVNSSATMEGISIAGTDDGLAGNVDWSRTLRDRTDGPKLLLTHGPDLLDRAPEGAPRFDLALSGHTHGGQARLGPFAPLVPPGSGRFVAGHYQTRLGPAFVSRGTGTSILPARFLCRPELPLFRLVRG
jgi:uncharacterized protein